MNKITERKNALVEEIRAGEVYKRYEAVKVRMRDYPDKKALVDGFREKSYVMTTQDSEYGPDVSQVLEEREKLKEDPLIAEYLDAELALCRMLQRISMEIMNVSDLEIDSFADRIHLR